MIPPSWVTGCHIRYKTTTQIWTSLLKAVPRKLGIHTTQLYITQIDRLLVYYTIILPNEAVKESETDCSAYHTKNRPHACTLLT